jgi:glycosyltransferase involved in cell wall biosynthesis
VISISVVIPAFNRAAIIQEALSSVRAQTRSPLETIVIDDASADGTAEVAEREGARVIRLKQNRGAAGARNEGIRAARGDAIALLDSDDFWEPHHLATVASLLEQNPEAAAAGAAVRFVGTKTGVWKGRIPEGPPTVVVREAFKDWLTPTSTTVVRRDALLAVGGFDESERYSEDFDLWLRLARRFRFVASREITANWRAHPDQLSSNLERQWLALYKFRIRALGEIRGEGDLPLAEDLSEILRVHWANDVQRAWDNGRSAWLKQLVSLAPLIPELPGAQRLSWELRSRIPERARPMCRAILRIARSTLRAASGGTRLKS